MNKRGIIMIKLDKIIVSNDHKVQFVYILYHKKKQEIQQIFL